MSPLKFEILLVAVSPQALLDASKCSIIMQTKKEWSPQRCKEMDFALLIFFFFFWWFGSISPKHSVLQAGQPVTTSAVIMFNSLLGWSPINISLEDHHFSKWYDFFQWGLWSWVCKNQCFWLTHWLTLKIQTVQSIGKDP